MPKSSPSWYVNGKDHVWHPYSQMQTMPEPIKVAGTQGNYIHLEDGTKLLDGISSWWSTCHGYNHLHIIKAMEAQLKTMPHVMFAGTSHEQAYTLAARLCTLTHMEKVFFTDSGSTSVETALKMAVQYWRNKGEKNRSKFISFSHGYHGDTMGCMSLCDPDKGMHKSFNNYMPMQMCMDIPTDEYAFSEMDYMLGGVSNLVAGVVIEPLVQGAGGMKFHTADTLAEIYRIVKKHNLLFIADEVMTGFGRTGMMFACEEAGITPDIMCVGKALTGGTMTLAATLAKQEIFDAFLGDKLEQALMCGPTFMANPLACAAANASLDLFEKEPRLSQVEAIEQQLFDELRPLKKHDKVVDVRVKGAIGVVQLADTNWEELFKMREKCVKEGVWLRPFGDVIYLMPPFTITPKELTKLTDVVKKLIG